MIVICCLDQKNGMLFYNRRQSMDKILRSNLADYMKGQPLYMNHYSKGQFDDYQGKIIVRDDFLACAKKGEYCFVENERVHEALIEKIIIYRWDKIYPADTFFEVNWENYQLRSTMEFVGNSHEKIMREVYDAKN